MAGQFAGLLTALLAACAFAEAQHKLPPLLQKVPRLSDYDLHRSLPGILSKDAVEALAKKPRAIVGYLSDKEWALMEFLCMAHAAWRYVAPLAVENGLQLDMIVFSDTRWLKEVSSICTRISLAQARDEGYAGLFGSGARANCLVVHYPTPPAHVWHGYPFINNVHFLADPLVASLLRNYGYAMKTDFDTFITPSLVQHFPHRPEAGVMEYVLLPETAQRLQRIAARLGLRHRGLHNLGPTWYADVDTLLAVANLSIPIMYDIYMREFEHRAAADGSDGGLAQAWQQGEGWPAWNGGAIAMYASDLAFNHLLQDFESSDRYDHHADSGRYVFTLYHVHCRHGDGDFSKFEFFKHHYPDTDPAKLDFHIVRNYAMSLAVTTWRHIELIQQQQLAQLLRQQQQQQQQDGLPQGGTAGREVERRRRDSAEL